MLPTKDHFRWLHYGEKISIKLVPTIETLAFSGISVEKATGGGNKVKV